MEQKFVSKVWRGLLTSRMRALDNWKPESMDKNSAAMKSLETRGNHFIDAGKECILREIGWDGVDWIDMAQDRDQWRPLVNKVLNLRVP
jgi:hypothetical protein